MAQSAPPDADQYARLRKRILMFYFAAGINLVMAMWVFSMSSGVVAGGTVTIVMLIFIAFAGLNYYMARVLQKKWNAHVRQQNQPRASASTSDGV